MENKDMESEKLCSRLHKVFVDLTLENDLKGEELEWFKSKICPRRVEHKKEKKRDSERRKMEIITEYKLEKLPEKTKKLILKLSETNTVFFFSLSTIFSQDNVEDAEKVRRENETYEMKKMKKEIIRKRCTADAQTPRLMVKSRETLTTEIFKENKFVFASEWDMYDTYNALEKGKVTAKNYLRLQNPTKRVNLEEVSIEEDVNKTFASLSFKYASLVCERLLASNCFQYKQSVFKKDFKTRYYTGPTNFSYNMEVLWTFQKDLEHPLIVTDMDWNPLNQDLLAVGYGDLSFNKKCLGFIYVWSAKNPQQPERQFQFEDSVTSLDYSDFRPNILAAGTRSGNIYVLDVSSQEKNIRILGSDCLTIHSGPVWKIEWFLHKELVFETEDLLAVGESGVLMIFSTSPERNTKDILKLEYVTSTRQLLEKMPSKKQLNQPYHEEVFDKKTFSGLCFSVSFDKNFCNVSTKEGVVVKCNLTNPSMENAIFLAHDGPVYKIQHSPVTDLVYLTCGADWNIKIWMEGIFKPVITLQQKAPVTCAIWSPTIPTLIASAGESELSLWDIGRNILFPMATQNFENCGKRISTLLFSLNGANLILGCENGLVLVVHLSELPRIPFLQKEALISAIRKALLRNKNELFREFCRALAANKNKLKTKVIDNLQ